jgi:NADH dehydrogenase
MIKLVIGSTGFIGRELVRQLVKKYPGQVRAMARTRQKLGDIAHLPGLEVTEGDILNRTSLDRAMQNVDTVFHFAAVTANFKNTENLYYKVHVEGTRNVIAAAEKVGVKRIVLCSGLGTVPDKPGSYMQTRWEMEELARHSKMAWTIVRPSIVFGEGSEFFEGQARIIKRVPVAAMVGSAKLKFQPVHVADAARASIEASEREDKIGKTIDLVGSQVFTYEKLIKLILATTRKKRLIMSLPIWAARIGAFGGAILPNPPLTPALVDMFTFDNIAPETDVIEYEFGFKPELLEPYLEKHGIKY